MQFSLRRMSVAVALFATVFGTLFCYDKRQGMFRSDSDPTGWWVAVTALAVAVTGVLLVGHWRDLGRVLNASVWTAVGFFAGEMIEANHLLFMFLGRTKWPVQCILGGLIGWCIGCILFRWGEQSFHRAWQRGHH
jgi:hypothetical protein